MSLVKIEPLRPKTKIRIIGKRHRLVFVPDPIEAAITATAELVVPNQYR